jgi:tetratricopeptide (TPR) repeat protein
MAGTAAVYGATHPGVAAASGNLSVALLAQGRYREAEEAATHALSLGDPHGAGAIAYRINVGIAQQCRGAMTDAIATYRIALADAQAHAEGDALERVQILVNLAEALSLHGDHDEARTAVARASAELDAVAPAQHPARAMVLAAEAAAARRRGDAVIALSAAERAAAFEGLPPPWRMPVLLELGEALIANARGREAIAPLREAAALTGFDARVSAQVAAALAHALISTGATTEAHEIAAAALARYPAEGEPTLRDTLAVLAGD